jgi:hypothetical protein
LGVVDLDLVDGDLASATRDLQHVGQLPRDECAETYLDLYVARCGRLAALRGAHADGVTLLAAAETTIVDGAHADGVVYGTPATSRHPLERLRLADGIAKAQARMSEALFSAAWERGKGLSLEEAADLADEIVGV